MQGWVNNDKMFISRWTVPLIYESKWNLFLETEELRVTDQKKYFTFLFRKFPLNQIEFFWV